MKYKVDRILVRGIYFLYRRGKIVYIGQSKSNVMRRICDHMDDITKHFDEFSFEDKYELSDLQLNQAEKNLINKHKPRYNKLKNFKKRPSPIIYGLPRLKEAEPEPKPRKKKQKKLTKKEIIKNANFTNTKLELE